MKREEDDKARENTELVNERNETYFYSPSEKKSRKRKKHHLANKSRFENRKRHKTMMTASQEENFEIRVKESVDSGKLGTDFHEYLLASEESKERGRVKYIRMSDEGLEFYGDEKLVGKSVKLMSVEKLLFQLVT